MWLLPNNHQEIRTNYNMKHIPHVTLKCNLEKPDFRLAGKEADINFNRSFVWFPQMYKPAEGRRASGFYCSISSMGEEIMLNHEPHMTVWYDYFGPHDVYANSPPEDTRGKVFCADARSPNPEEWELLSWREFRDSQESPSIIEQ